MAKQNTFTLNITLGLNKERVITLLAQGKDSELCKLAREWGVLRSGPMSQKAQKAAAAALREALNKRLAEMNGVTAVAPNPAAEQVASPVEAVVAKTENNRPSGPKNPSEKGKEANMAQKTTRFVIDHEPLAGMGLEELEGLLKEKNPAKQFARLMEIEVVNGGGPRATKEQKNAARLLAVEEVRKELDEKRKALAELQAMSPYDRALAEGYKAEDLAGANGQPLSGGALTARLKKLDRLKAEAKAEVAKAEVAKEFPSETILQYVLRAWSVELDKLRKAFPQMNIGWDAAAKAAQDYCVRQAQSAKDLQQEQEVEVLTVASITEHRDRLMEILEKMRKRNAEVSAKKKDLDEVIKKQEAAAAAEEENVSNETEKPAVEAQVVTEVVTEETAVEGVVETTEEVVPGTAQGLKSLQQKLGQMAASNLLMRKMKADMALPEGVTGKDFLKLVASQGNPEFRDELLCGLGAELGDGAKSAIKAIREGRGGSLPQAQVRKVKAWSRETVERVWRLALDRATARVIEKLKAEAEEAKAKEAAAKAAEEAAEAAEEKMSVTEDVTGEGAVETKVDNVEAEVKEAEVVADVEAELETKDVTGEEQVVEAEEEARKGHPWKKVEAGAAEEAKKESVMKKLKSAWSWLVKKVDDATYYPEDRKQELEKRRGAWKALAEEDRKALAKALKQIRKDRKGREVGFDPASESAKALAGLMGKLADKGWDFNFLSQLETIEFTLLMASFFDAKADASFMAEKLKVQKVVREGQGEGYLLNPENPGYGAIVDTLNWEMLGNYGMYKRLERQMPGVIQAKGELWLWTVVELVGLSGLAVASPFVGVGLALWNLAAIPVSAMKAETGEKKEAVKSRLSKAFDGIIAGFRLSGIALAFGAQWTWDRKVEAAGGIAGAVVGAITNGLTGGVVGAIVGGVVGNLVREAWAGLKSWWAGRKAKKAAEVKSNEAELKSEAAAPAAAC